MLPSCWSRRWGESSTSAHWRREAKVPAFNSLRRPTAFPWQRWGRWGTCVNMWHPEAKTWSKKQFLQNGWSATWSGLKRLEASGIIWSAESSMTQSGSVLSSIFTWPREVPSARFEIKLQLHLFAASFRPPAQIDGARPVSPRVSVWPVSIA